MARLPNRRITLAGRDARTVGVDETAKSRRRAAATLVKNCMGIRPRERFGRERAKTANPRAFIINGRRTTACVCVCVCMYSYLGVMIVVRGGILLR